MTVNWLTKQQAITTGKYSGIQKGTHRQKPHAEDDVTEATYLIVRSLNLSTWHTRWPTEPSCWRIPVYLFILL